MSAIAATIRCNWCSKEKLAFLVHTLVSGQAICENCLDGHFKALEFLAGSPPELCQACRRTWAELRDADVNAIAVRMYVVPKDGILQLLCDACVVPYTAKRADLYAGTSYWSQLKA